MSVYKLKVAIRDISPMIWGRFHIHGKDYGISYEGGLSFYNTPPEQIHSPHFSLKIAISLLMSIIFIAIGC